MKKLAIICFFLILPLLHCGYRTVTIIATNDIHGHALPQLMQRSDTKEDYTYGGLQYLASMVEIIKQQNPGNVLYLDSGDQFQGGLESSPKISKGKTMYDFFDIVGLNANAIGNHEFDFGKDFLFKYLKAKDNINLAANIRSQKGQSVFMPKQLQSKIFKLANGIKIGLIGLTTTDTPQQTNAFKDGLFPTYLFLDYKDIVIKQSAILRKAGAHAVLILGHLGNACTVNNTYGNWSEKTPQPECGSHDESSMLIDALPKGTIDGIIQGHRHKFAHHYHKGVPYLGAISGGYYFNILHLKFNSNRLVKTTIEGPIPVCEKVFENLNTCGYLNKKQIKKAGDLVPYYFHGELVEAHPQLDKIYEEEWSEMMEKYEVNLFQTQIKLQIQKEAESELANVFLDMAMSLEPGVDFAFVNPGFFRTTWYPGFINEQQYYNMFPLKNDLITFDMTGKEIVDVMKIIQSGKKGFYHVAGLVLTGKVNQDQTHQFVSVTLQNGDQIQPQKVYRGISIDFLLHGGDDFKLVPSSVYTPRNEKRLGVTRDLMRPKWKQLQIVEEDEHIDPQHPRLIVLRK